MERLTFDGNFCDIAQCTAMPCQYGGNCDQKKVWDRLKEYEDIGCSPHACASAAKLEHNLTIRDWSTERLLELWYAEHEGRLVILPREEDKVND